ncbi:MAG: 16S rRNA (adenine(1518)-N(6)/adenine(1519)-N(6))-dimethyltransferase RsmA [Clostridia bacterium]|jgi:16S rRNA (adenine1518-N6/adenine1519-N6)-dimethyltransferase|nr:16S rRNA (adenine(1518)-N(6)/adenine(1519)-N(6))-dimethyltransferase RsmA [Clostridia bacterium]
MGLKEILAKHGFKFKKRFGQNFITDPGILNKIVDVAEITKDDLVIEVGPGLGTLTKTIAERAGRVITIEIDKDLIPILQETLEGLDNVDVVEGDALKLNLDQLVLEKLGELKPYKIVANLPYYITTPLIMHFLEEGYNVERIVVMVQKEVAERIVANPGTKEYGALTVNLQLFTQAKIAFTVPRHVFTPKPDVDSAIVDLVVRKEPLYPIQDREFLRKIITAAFGQRRKTLLNSLGSLTIDKKILNEAMEGINLDSRRRGETLSLEEFVLLANGILQRLNNG